MDKKKMDRRKFLKVSAATAATGIVASSCAGESGWEKFFQKHYSAMSAEDKKKVFRRIEKEIEADYRIDVTVNGPDPIENVKFSFGLNLSVCNGSRRCVEACRTENNLDEDMYNIKVIEMDKGGLDFEAGTAYYDHDKVPIKDKIYLPVQCQQCDNPPCVKACPVGATWKEKDGIVAIDYDYCIGCRYCQAACPYEARHFNYRTPKVPRSTINTKMSYLSNRIRPRGVMEKCTFCLHRSREGRYPACLEACPTGARKFGNVLDKNGEMYKLLKEKRVFILKEEIGTIPSFFYYFD